MISPKHRPPTVGSIQSCSEGSLCTIVHGQGVVFGEICVADARNDSGLLARQNRSGWWCAGFFARLSTAENVRAAGCGFARSILSPLRGRFGGWRRWGPPDARSDSELLARQNPRGWWCDGFFARLSSVARGERKTHHTTTRKKRNTRDCKQRVFPAGHRTD